MQLWIVRGASVVTRPHGGRREGAGRKPLNAQPMVTRAFVITQEQATWLDLISRETGRNKSRVIREMIDASNYARLKTNLNQDGR